MEAQMEIQNYLEQGRTALAQGKEKAREAAFAFAKGAQLEPNNPVFHLGLAEANLALGDYPFVREASRKVLELQPTGGCEAKIAQALLDLLDHRYDRALQRVDAAIEEDPSIAYVHALRSYLLRANGQEHDADRAMASAIRRSYGGRFENCFPSLEPATQKKANSAEPRSAPLGASPTNGAVRSEAESAVNWSRPNGMRRQAIRTGFFLNQNPGFVTNAIIAIIAILYLFSSMSNIYDLGSFDLHAVRSGQIWRFVTSLFMYYPGDLLPMLINLLALFFVGRVVEMFYGPYRYLGIYLLVGILSNLVIFLPVAHYGLGPQAPLMGIFGAIGVFYFANRRGLGGFGGSAIVSWVFWLVLNLGMAWTAGPAAIGNEVFCILMGMVLGYLFLLRSGRGRTRW